MFPPEEWECLGKRLPENLNKLQIYATGGKCFEFENQPPLLPLSSSCTTLHLPNNRHSHIMDVVVVGKIEKHLHQGILISCILLLSEGVHQSGPTVYDRFLHCRSCGIAGTGWHSVAQGGIDYASRSTMEALF